MGAVLLLLLVVAALALIIGVRRPAGTLLKVVLLLGLLVPFVSHAFSQLSCGGLAGLATALLGASLIGTFGMGNRS